MHMNIYSFIFQKNISQIICMYFIQFEKGLYRIIIIDPLIVMCAEI